MKQIYLLKTMLLVLVMSLFGGKAWADDVTITIKNTDYVDNYDGTQGSMELSFSDSETLTIVHSGVKTKSSSTANAYSYGYAMYMNGAGYAYSTSAPSGYYVKSVTAQFSGSTGTSGYVGVSLGSSSINERNSSVSSSVSKNGSYVFNNTDQSKTYWNFSSTNANVQVSQLTIVYSEIVASAVATPTINTEAGDSYTSKTVSITVPEGCTVYYTLDGTDPTDESTQYTAPFVVSETTTVKAIAYNEDDQTSNIAQSTITILPLYNSIEGLKAVSEKNAKDCFVTFNNWIVNAATTNNAYVVDDNGDGALIYVNNHGFKAGDKLSGTIKCKTQLYNGMTELTGFTASAEGLTITSDNEVTVEEKDLSAITSADFGHVVTVKNVNITTSSYTANTTKVKSGDTEVVLYNTFGCLNGKTFSTEAKYDVTGVVILYNETLEIAPRTAADVVSKLVAATSSWSATQEIVKLSGSLQAEFTTNSSGAVTFESSNTNVIDYDPDDGWQIVGKGTAVITATTAENSEYIKSVSSMTVIVIGDNDVFATWVAADEGLENAADLTTYNADEKISIAFDKASGSNMPKYYTDGKTARAYINNTITVAVPEGYALSQINIHFQNGYSANYVPNSGTFTPGTDAVWKGFTRSVVFTVPGTSRILSMDVYYTNDLEHITRNVTAGNYGTLCLPYSSSDFNATIYQIAGTRVDAEENVSGVVLEEVKNIVAGQSYIFLCEESTLDVIYDPSQTAVTNTVATTGLVGNLGEGTVTVADGNYVVSNNKIRKVNGGTATIGQYRAYLDLSSVDVYTEETQSAPSKRIVELNVEGAATAIDSIEAEVKEAVIYDLSGRRVNKMEKGIYIVNGKKVVVR